MNGGVFHDAGLSVALSTMVQRLLNAIWKVRETTKRFKPLLNQLNDTVNWISPRINEISRSTDSQEIERLMDLLKQAKETVDKCSGVSSWNYYKKYKFAKELMELDNSIRTTLQVFFPVMILGDTRKILDAVDELKLMLSIFFNIILEDFHSGAKNTGGFIFDLIRSKIVQSQPAEIVSDIAQWKSKKLSGSLLFTSSATWVLQQVYECNFLSIASWVAILIITSLFIWRYANRLRNKEEATKSRLESIREQVVREAANACSELTDKVMRWIFHVTDVEGEWFVFPQTVAFLLILSYVGSFFDLPTLCRVVASLMVYTTVPVIVEKYGDRIKPFGRTVVGRVYEMVEEKLMTTVKNNAVKEEMKKKSKKQN